MTRKILSILLLLISFFISGCEQPPVVERIQSKEEIIFAILESPTSYYQGLEGPMGFEYELARRFAQSIGVEARFKSFKHIRELRLAVAKGTAHVAAGSLSINDTNKKLLKFSEPYQTIETHVVYRRGSLRPRKPEDLQNGILWLAADGNHKDIIHELEENTDEKLNWEEVADKNTDELLNMVDKGQIDYTLANDYQLALSQRYNHHLRIGFTLEEETKLGWGFAKNTDDSLIRSANIFFSILTKYQLMGELVEKYYGYTDNLNFVDKRLYFRHIAQRLPKYKEFFLMAEAETGLDWRLLAAIGYQESHWQVRATSNTGVRGIMMLTRATAKELGIKNRIDPENSILGGARYLKILEEKIPASVPMPDRIWLALAGYNLGFRHLTSIRKTVKHEGGNPNSWHHIKEKLPTKASKKKNENGFSHSRGVQARNYVDKVRYYYDLLVWKLGQK